MYYLIVVFYGKDIGLTTYVLIKDNHYIIFMPGKMYYRRFMLIIRRADHPSREYNQTWNSLIVVEVVSELQQVTRPNTYRC
jgi:hypothetical protein